MDILVFNPGSTTLKVSLVGFSGGKGQLKSSQTVSHAQLDDTVREALRSFEYDAVACRHVDGGGIITSPSTLDTALLQRLVTTESLAPLHNPISLRVLKLALEETRKPLVVDTDTSFHQTLPETERVLPLPKKLRELLRPRTGYHGIAHREVSSILAWKLGEESRARDYLISCQLGGGASICAIREGASVSVTMGSSPLEGVVMGSRSGSLDPGTLLTLLEEHGFSASELRSLLNCESGLLGLTGTLDLRLLSQQAQQGDTSAELGLEVFCSSIAKGIASTATSLPRIDAIAFSGGIGQNSADIRARICRKLAVLGVSIDPERNTPTEDLAEPRKLSPDGAATAVWAIPSSEHFGLARSACSIL